MNIKYKTWDDISISKYDDILSVISNEEDDELTKEVKLTAVLCDISEDNAWNLSMDEMAKIRAEMAFINDFKWKKDLKFKRIKIGDYDLKVIKVEDMTIAQYVDFQTYYENMQLAELISVFYIPKGKKYNEGYDMADLINTIKDNISIINANEIVFFSLKRWLKSLKTTITFSIMKLKILKMVTRGKIAKNEIQTLISKLEEVRSLYGSI